MAITGHKTRSVFDRYDIVNEADLRDALGKLTDAPVTEPATPGKVEPFKDRRARA